MSEFIHIIALVLHILGAGIIIGSIFASLLILINDRISKDNLKYLKLLWKFISPAIAVQVITGIYLTVQEWNKFGKNPIFWMKMILLIVDGLFGGKVLERRIKKADIKKDNNIEIFGSHRLIRISFFIFLIIITLGVFLTEGGQQ